MKQDDGLTAASTWFDKVLNAGEDLSESSAVKTWSILNSNTTFGSGGGADVVVVGTLVVVVTTVGLEVTTVVSLLVMVAGRDVVVSGITVVEDGYAG